MKADNQSEVCQLENGHIAVAFDRRNGALNHLLFKHTGWEVQRRAALSQSFSMLIPLPDKRHHRVNGLSQPLSSLSVNRAGDILTLVWDNMVGESGTSLDVRFTGTVTLAKNTLTFTACIENKSEHVVEAVVWPWLGDLSRPDDSKNFYHLHEAYGDYVDESLFPHFANHRGCFSVEHPVQLSNTPANPFVLAHNGEQGLYAGYHDTSAEHLLQFRFQQRPGFEFSEGFECGTVHAGDMLGETPVHLEFATVHFPYAGHGTTKLKSVVLAPYSGTWHAGADVYKEWRKTWYAPPKSPAWVKEIHSWQQIHVNSPEEEYGVPYRDLPDFAKECAEHGVGALQITGWATGGQDRNNPSHDIEPRLGTVDELRQALEEIKALGVNPVLFSKFTWSDRSAEHYRDRFIRLAMTDPYGDAYYYPGYMYLTETQLANINTRRLIPMCMQSVEWRDIARGEFEKVLSHGAAGTLYDECQHHGGANYCFNPAHGHAVPGHVFAGDGPLAESFLDAISKTSGEFLLAGEDCYDLQLQHYHLSYFRIGKGHKPLRRYVAPDTEMMVAVLGYNNRTVINQALLYRYILSYEPRGFKGHLNEFPLTVEYGRQIDALRERYADWLWHAEFRDSQGAEVVVLEGPESVRFTVFHSHKHGLRAVALMNEDYELAATVQVSLPHSATNLSVVRPEDGSPAPYTESVVLPPVSAAVVLEFQE
jgi:hypothetical protein